ncbi:MAG: phosphoserine phosphatase SerB [Brevibacterium aurantiacum]|uniref:phosphoserine phosphatase n=1 Tax=Brevibacterium aurantiacum TaxID=273384 RepID=A0A2A3ZVA4_BREAU|nr:phosphoserine phosphatase SerB [Brevibacterium aurantiacum]AZL09505.1 phosphoserine phosphatase SerB [Brevibacterium aurantiacum]PCC55418.1 phosphoserine phosphatase SerB [Brevibacterium aurantiacum]PCC58359.1 phosphoserine phosphatase SerB [Brevibacterium aurantiacum]
MNDSDSAAPIPGNSIQLLVMDVDSTFINEEVIDLIAVHAEVGAQVADITERAMAGQLDFAASLAERVALLKGLPVSVLDEVRAQITLTQGARELVAAVQSGGGVVALVSGGFTQIIAPVAEAMGITEVFANGLDSHDGLLTGVTSGRVIDPSAKAEIFSQLIPKYDCDPARTVAVGDGANDIGMIQAAGLGVAFCAKPALVAAADAAVTNRDLREVLTLIETRAQV